MPCKTVQKMAKDGTLLALAYVFSLGKKIRRWYTSNSCRIRTLVQLVFVSGAFCNCAKPSV
jgi:hypothetical protein